MRGREHLLAGPTGAFRWEVGSAPRLPISGVMALWLSRRYLQPHLRPSRTTSGVKGRHHTVGLRQQCWEKDNVARPRRPLSSLTLHGGVAQEPKRAGEDP